MAELQIDIKELIERLEEVADNFRKYRDENVSDEREWLYSSGCYDAVMGIIHELSSVVE